jgi:lysozyme
VIVPSKRPEISRVAVEDWLTSAGVLLTAPVIVGRRGYYRDSMGAAGENDRAMYDDAIIYISPTAFATFNGNTDPSRFGGRLATLQPGIYRYKLGIHHPSTPKAYPCLVQAGPVTVKRDNGITESGEFYIHIHRGGYTTTSSEGCQTLYPDQWDEFFIMVQNGMQHYALKDIEYVLLDRGET